MLTKLVSEGPVEISLVNRLSNSDSQFASLVDPTYVLIKDFHIKVTRVDTVNTPSSVVEIMRTAFEKMESDRDMVQFYNCRWWPQTATREQGHEQGTQIIADQEPVDEDRGPLYSVDGDCTQF